MVALPSEFRGEPVRIIVKKEPTKSPTRDDAEISIDDFLKKYTGILKDCDIESVEAMKEDRGKGILGLRGILKGYTLEELETARDDYLTEKYIHD